MNHPATAYALVTGASSGIGESFARRLAGEGRSLVLVARSADRLSALAGELARARGVRALALPADLADPTAPARIFAETEGRGLPVDLLVNNAGFGTCGEFARLPAATELELLRVNVLALVDLTHRFLVPMLARRAGAIVNVASTAGFQPVPYHATYAASKAFVLNFSQAIAEEVRGQGVTVLALCPGTTRTPFFDRAGIDLARSDWRMEEPEAVVETALRALRRRNTLTISGWLNRLMIQSQRLAPRALVARAAATAMRARVGRAGGSY
jgi:short-subunit dehydrogenase